MKLLQMLKIELAEDPHGPQMLDIGSCGLHVVNVAFKTGIKKTSWTLLAFFRACYYLFKDSPSRRGTYMAVTGSSTFPMKFCSVRWLENVDVAKRALETLDNLKKFVEYISTHKNMKATASSASFKVISCSLKDKLLRPKLAFFLSLAEDLEPFLKEFQSDCPMSPFLHGNLLNILKTCMERVVKDNVLGSTLLQKVDLKKEENLKGARDIDIGYATRSALRKCQGIKDIDVLLFRQDCRTCLKNVVDKLLERSPLKFPLTEALTFLNPYKIGFNQDEAVQQMTSAMDILVTSNLIPASVAQNADREYKELVSQEKDWIKENALNRICEEPEQWFQELASGQGDQVLPDFGAGPSSSSSPFTEDLGVCELSRQSSHTSLSDPLSPSMQDFTDDESDISSDLEAVVLRISHSSLMSSDRMKPRLGDWAVTINFLREAAITSLSSGSNNASATECSRALVDTITKYEIPYENVVCVVTDGARYMTKCKGTSKRAPVAFAVRQAASPPGVTGQPIPQRPSHPKTVAQRKITGISIHPLR
uniref:Uncharacterized protein n=1 Tax=Timema tahoe TaxID=61484 RepID=A0A7R9FJ03_9NEOP|nr:unnamed protein product [Timema tahoe]